MTIGCVAAGREVAFDTGDPRFESQVQGSALSGPTNLLDRSGSGNRIDLPMKLHRPCLLYIMYVSLVAAAMVAQLTNSPELSSLEEVQLS